MFSLHLHTWRITSQSPLNIFTIHNCKSILTFVIFSSVSDDTKNSKTGGDFLTCGGCRRKYDLADLTKFVQHKVLDCNKENSKLSSGECIIIIIIMGILSLSYFQKTPLMVTRVRGADWVWAAPACPAPARWTLRRGRRPSRRRPSPWCGTAGPTRSSQVRHNQS